MDIDEKSLWFDEKFNKNYGGYYPINDNIKRIIAEMPMHDSVRKDMLILLMRSIIERGIMGSVAEVGVFKGITAKLLHCYLPDRKLFLFDSFQGFDPDEINNEKKETDLIVNTGHFANTNVSAVLKYINPINDNVIIISGKFPESAAGKVFPEGFAFVHLDADLYNPTKNGLDYFYPKMNPGGFILIHDYNAWPGARKAVEEFSKKQNIIPIPFPDKSGSCLIIRGGS